MIDSSGIDVFIKDLRKKCRDHGIELKLIRSKKVPLDEDKTMFSAGYFDSGGKQLVVAINRPDYLQILIHESSHLDQYIENCKAWRGEKNGFMVDEWLSGKDWDKRKIKRAINNTISLELDCEKRSVKKIIQYNLPVGETVYIQKANAYLLFYNFMFYVRRWIDPNNCPYVKPEVYNKMPTKFMSDDWYKKPMSPKYWNLFVDNGF